MNRANRTRNLGTVALALCALLAQGCSAIFVRPPAADATSEPPGCTESRAAPLADALLAGVAATFGAAGLQATLNQCSPSDNCGETLMPGLAVLGSAVFLAAGGSAYYGFRQTRRCADAWTSWCGLHDCEAPEPGEHARR